MLQKVSWLPTKPRLWGNPQQNYEKGGGRKNTKIDEKLVFLKIVWWEVSVLTYTLHWNIFLISLWSTLIFLCLKQIEIYNTFSQNQILLLFNFKLLIMSRNEASNLTLVPNNLQQKLNFRKFILWHSFEDHPTLFHFSQFVYILLTFFFLQNRHESFVLEKYSSSNIFSPPEKSQSIFISLSTRSWLFRRKHDEWWMQIHANRWTK